MKVYFRDGRRVEDNVPREELSNPNGGVYVRWYDDNAPSEYCVLTPVPGGRYALVTMGNEADWMNGADPKPWPYALSRAIEDALMGKL